ncbi:MAG: hypothetical protein QM785_14630 [Pyrinomonadaceae bacterium]
MKLSLLILLILACSAFSNAQTEADAPAATDIRRIIAGGPNGSPWIGAYGWQWPNSIYMQSFGDESYISFTINWDPRQLLFLQAENGIDLPAGSQITLNQSRLALGSLGITINSPQAVREGTINLVNLQFYTRSYDPTFAPGIPVTFSSDPTPQLIRGLNGEELSAIYTNPYSQFLFADPNTAFSLGGGSVLPGQTILIPMAMGEVFSPFTGQASFRFSVEWDSTRFSFVDAAVGSGVPPGSTLDLDTSQLSQGRLGMIMTGNGPAAAKLSDENHCKRPPRGVAAGREWLLSYSLL